MRLGIMIFYVPVTIKSVKWYQTKYDNAFRLFDAFHVFDLLESILTGN